MSVALQGGRGREHLNKLLHYIVNFILYKFYFIDHYLSSRAKQIIWSLTLNSQSQKKCHCLDKFVLSSGLNE